MESAGVMPCPVLLAAACLRLSRLLSAIELRELHWTGGVVLVRWLLLLRTPISIPSEVSLQPALRNTEPISRCTHRATATGHNMGEGEGVLSVLISTGLPWNLEGWGRGCSQCSYLLGCHGTWKVGGGGVLSAHIYWAIMEPARLGEGVFSVLTSTGLPWNLQGWGWGVLSVLISTGLPWNLEGWGRGCSQCSYLLGCHGTCKVGGGGVLSAHIYWVAMEPARLGEGVFSVLTSTGLSWNLQGWGWGVLSVLISTGLPWNLEGWGRGCSQCSYLLGCHGTWKVGGGGVLSAHIYWAVMEPGRLGEGVFSVLISTGLSWNLQGWGRGCSQCSHLLGCHGTCKVGGGGVLSAHIYWAIMEPARLGEGVFSVLTSTGLPWNLQGWGWGVLSVLISTGLPWNLEGWGRGCSQCSYLLGCHGTWKVGGGGVLSAHIYWAVMEPGRLGEGVLSMLTSTGLPWNLEGWGRGCSQCSHLLGCHGTWKVGGGGGSQCSHLLGCHGTWKVGGGGWSQCSHLLVCHGTWKVGGGGVLSAHIYWAAMEPGRLGEGVFSVLTSTGLPWNLEGWGIGVLSVLTSTGLPWNLEGWGRGGCSQCSHLLGCHGTWKVRM